jgi:basic amino acid/polyamine antiporter, APA family
VSAAQPHRLLLSPFAAITITVGIVVGAGIFKTPSMVAGVTNDLGWLLALWVIGALLSLAGALCYAELCTAFPSSGGEYHFLQRSYGRTTSFLYAWAKAFVINPGAIALLGYVFGDYLSQVWSLGVYSSSIWAAVVITLLTLSNLLGLKVSARLQTILLLAAILGLLLVVVTGLSNHSAEGSVLEMPWFQNTPSLGALGLAMVFVLLTFGGWGEAAYLSSEVRGQAKTMMWVLVISLLIISILYLLINVSLVHALGLQGLAASKAAVADAMRVRLGPWAEIALASVVALAAITSINATIIIGSRTIQSLGADWRGLHWLSQWKDDTNVPVSAILLQAAISLLLVVFGAFQHDGFESMVEFTAPVFWFFLTLVGLSLIVLRVRESSVPRAFRVPLYPWTPILFSLSSAYLTWSSMGYAASQDAVSVSIGVMVVGIVALLLIKRQERTEANNA